MSPAAGGPAENAEATVAAARARSALTNEIVGRTLTGSAGRASAGRIEPYLPRHELPVAAVCSWHGHHEATRRKIERRHAADKS